MSSLSNLCLRFSRTAPSCISLDRSNRTKVFKDNFLNHSTTWTIDCTVLNSNLALVSLINLKECPTTATIHFSASRTPPVSCNLSCLWSFKPSSWCVRLPTEHFVYAFAFSLNSDKGKYDCTFFTYIHDKPNGELFSKWWSALKWLLHILLLFLSFRSLSDKDLIQVCVCFLLLTLAVSYLPLHLPLAAPGESRWAGFWLNTSKTRTYIHKWGQDACT